MVTVKLVGFNSSIPKTLNLHANSYREAVEALKQHDGFNPRKASHRYMCDIDNVNCTLDLDEPIADGEMTLRRKQTLKSYKSFQGAGNTSGFQKVVIGIVLITVAVFIMPAITVGFAGAAFTTTSLNMVLVQVGIALIVGGVIQELTPGPKDNELSEESSNTATSYQNTVQSGTPIAMIFGKHRFGGHVFQFNIESVGRSSADIRQFTDIIWNDVSDNRRDSWLTLYYSSESNEIGQYDPRYRSGRASYDGIRGIQQE